MKDERIYLRIEDDLKKEMEDVARNENRTLSNWILNVLKQEMEKVRFKEYKTWVLKENNSVQYPLKFLKGRSLEEALRGNLLRLAEENIIPKWTYKIIDVMGYGLSYNKGAFGGHGGIELKIVVKCKKNENVFENEISVWIYGNENLEPENEF